MHRGHDHDHHHHDGHGHGIGHGHHHHPAPGPVGHNAPGVRPAQWQTPHLPQGPEAVAEPRAADMDLVETAFLESFARASDPVSFLRLSGIPFVGETIRGERLHLLRVETEDVVDVGSVMPLIGGAGLRYDPLPGRMTSHRRRLGFLYHDGSSVRRLGFTEARALADRTEAARIDREH